jgi:hypothetical protein
VSSGRGGRPTADRSVNGVPGCEPYDSVNASVAVATWCTFLVESVTCTEMGYDPAANLVLGVPERSPAELSFNPLGSAAPLFHL